MLRYYKSLICGGGVLVGAAMAVDILPPIFMPSEDEACISPRLMCAPEPVHMADRAVDDEPQPAPMIKPQVAATSSLATVQLSARSMIRMGGGGTLSST